MFLSFTGVVLALLATFAWSGLDVIRKQLVKDVAPVPLVVFLLLGQLPFFLLWALWDGRWIHNDNYFLPASLSIAFNVVADVLFVMAVRVSPLSRTIPFLSFTPVFAAMMALPILNESLSAQQWAGIGIVVMGALWLNRDLDESLLRSWSREEGSSYMVVVALLWAASTTYDKASIQFASPAAHCLIQTVAIAVILVGWLFARGREASLRAIQEHPRGLILMAIFATAALSLQMLAIQTLWVSVFETLKRGVGSVLSVLLGRKLFGEPITRSKVIAVFVMAAGTALLLVG